MDKNFLGGELNRALVLSRNYKKDIYIDHERKNKNEIQQLFSKLFGSVI